MSTSRTEIRDDVTVPEKLAGPVRAAYDAHVDYLDDLIARATAEHSRAVTDEQAAAARAGRVQRRLEALREERRKVFDDLARAFPDPDL